MMDIATVSAIIIASFGAVILVMAGMIRSMVVEKLDSIQASVNGIKIDIEEVKEEVHTLDIRVSKLETEHRLTTCIYEQRKQLREVING